MRTCFILGSFVVALLVASCGGVGAPAPPAGVGVRADIAPVIAGIPDRGDDPAVVAIDAGGDTPCTGVLIAPDVVLTARHCVWATAGPVECPASGPQAIRPVTPSTLRILVGDDYATAEERARGVEVVSPPGDILCGADIALVRLDVPIIDVAPVVLRGQAIGVGGHVRAVGFGRLVGGSPVELVREHAPVERAGTTEIEVAENACEGDTGGPALDETTGELVGVAARRSSSCDDASAYQVYTRVDAFFPLVDEVLAPLDGGPPRSLAGASSRAAKWKRGPLDMGSACARGVDCAAGVCVEEPSRRYCSRTCSGHDKCPTKFKCEAAEPSGHVCVQR
jgi:hypothetical protein